MVFPGTIGEWCSSGGWRCPHALVLRPETTDLFLGPENTDIMTPAPNEDNPLCSYCNMASRAATDCTSSIKECLAKKGFKLDNPSQMEAQPLENLTNEMSDHAFVTHGAFVAAQPEAGGLLVPQGVDQIMNHLAAQYKVLGDVVVIIHVELRNLDRDNAALMLGRDEERIRGNMDKRHENNGMILKLRKMPGVEWYQKEASGWDGLTLEEKKTAVWEEIEEEERLRVQREASREADERVRLELPYEPDYAESARQWAARGRERAEAIAEAMRRDDRVYRD